MSILTRTLPTAPGSYATAAEVRTVTGLSSVNDINDSDLNDDILTATLLFIGHVTIRVDGAMPTVMDAGRTVFQLPHGLVADINADAAVDSNDVTVRFYKQDTDGQILTADPGTVTVQNALLGVIKTQNALPTDYSVAVDYARYTRPLELNRAKRAVRYLAGHIAWLRVKMPGRITRADLAGIGAADPGERTSNSGEATFIFRHRSRWLDIYLREVNSIVGQPVV